MLGRDDVLAKTAQGRAWLATRDARYPAAWRAYVITVDGRKALAGSAQVLKALQLSLTDVQAMVDEGLLHVVQPETPQARAAPLLTPAGGVNKSLAAAKMYALDLVARLFGKADADLRESAREAIDRPSLEGWLQRCHAHICAELGEPRADAFLKDVQGVMPDLP